MNKIIFKNSHVLNKRKFVAPLILTSPPFYQQTRVLVTSYVKLIGNNNQILCVKGQECAYFFKELLKFAVSPPVEEVLFIKVHHHPKTNITGSDRWH